LQGKAKSIRLNTTTNLYGFYIYYQPKIKTVPDKHIAFSQSIVFDDFRFYYKKFDAFSQDKVFKENEDYIIGLDGVILNLKALKTAYAKADFFTLLLSLFKKEGISFVNSLKGEFSGFIFEKQTNKLYFYNNKTATKQVFYTSFKENLLIAPTIKALVEARENLEIKNKLNTKATYNMLTFGGMLEEETLVQEVYKLGAGAYLYFTKDKKIEVQKYYDYNNIDYTLTTKNKAIDRLNEVFINAVKLEYEKDTDYNYKHLATLSGGLDSRMNVMLAKKMGYNPSTFCFSQSGYADESIAQEIAKELNLDFKFIPLDGGNYLKTLTEMVGINNGLQFYHGSAHFNYAMKQLDLSTTGLIHTGQIGDAILGGMITAGKEKNYLSKTISNRFIKKATSTKELLSNYRDEEIFKLHQRQFNLTNYGSYMVEQHQTYLVSPFYDDQVLAVALSIHPDLKFNQGIYIDWIMKYHPETTKYKWERTGFKPNAKWKTAFSRYTNKLKQEFYNFTHQKNKLSMNPLGYWLQNNPSIEAFYKEYYNNNLKLIADNTTLFSDFLLLSKEGNFTEKALVLTILEVIKTYKLAV